LTVTDHSGKKVKATKGSITLRDNAATVTVTFKVGKKSKSLKIQAARVSC
jgi:hypothetical protein